MGPLLSFLAGPSGKGSSMRVLTCVVVCAIVGTWAWVSVRKETLQPMDPEHTALVLGALGIKAYQRKSETTKQKPDDA